MRNVPIALKVFFVIVVVEAIISFNGGSNKGNVVMGKTKMGAHGIYIGDERIQE